MVISHFVVWCGDIEDFAVRVATDHLDIDAIADWLKRHLQMRVS